MYLTDQFVFVEIPKTGTTSVNSWLDQLSLGERIGKHNVPNKQILDSNRIYVASLRDPWSWYLSMWSFGCQQYGQTGVYQALTNRNPLKVHHGYTVDKWLGINSFLKRSSKALSKEFARNKKLYSDVNDPALFKRWLRYVLNPDNAFLLSSVYHHSGIHQFVGLYSYIVVNLCCVPLRRLLKDRPESIEHLSKWVDEHIYVQRFLKLSQLKQDFIKLIQETNNQLENIDKVLENVKETQNATGNSGRLEQFYDKDTWKLVSDREKWLIDKFGLQVESAYSSIS